MLETTHKPADDHFSSKAFVTRRYLQHHSRSRHACFRSTGEKFFYTVSNSCNTEGVNKTNRSARPTGSVTDTGKPFPQGHYTVPGSLQNFNTENGFKNCDKALALKHVSATNTFQVHTPLSGLVASTLEIVCTLQAGQRVWHNILTGAAEEHPSCLCLFLLLSYADLKKFSYWSWYAHVPAVY